ncbi:MAG: ParB/RepB/Spo0J family partition protein [Halieaceae bacterium]|jgi:ParB family chromosome partitioning protein|nr:ParB/RepB/Spo0J family partition protein [Halieaceae bacterium]
MAAKKRGLGRGLDALLGASSAEATSQEGDKPAGTELRDVPVDLIRRGKYQPRRDIDPETLQELADSIKAQGVMQPIVLRPVENGKYEIIAGERRWRATQLAGLDSIPAQIRDVPDEAAIAMALIENIQREDLNPVEEALALQRLQQEFELTQQQVAEAVGKSRSAVANLLRLMSLRDDVRTLLEHGDIEMGHAKALLGLEQDEQSAAARSVVAKGLSVRQTESLVRQLLAAKNRAPKKPVSQDPNVRKLQDDLSEKLGTRVQIQHAASGKGKLVLSYSSLDELDGILSHIK